MLRQMLVGLSLAACLALRPTTGLCDSVVLGEGVVRTTAAHYGEPFSSARVAVGQTFHVLPDATQVTAFGFYLNDNDTLMSYLSDPAEFQAYIMQWDAAGQRVVGNPLYSSGTVQIESQTFSPYSFDIYPGLELDPNLQYVAFFSGLLPGDGYAFDGLLGLADVGGAGKDVMLGESAVFSKSGIIRFSSLLNTQAFATDAHDLAFTLTLNKTVTVQPDPVNTTPTTNTSEPVVQNEPSPVGGMIASNPEPASVVMWTFLASVGLASTCRQRRRKGS